LQPNLTVDLQATEARQAEAAASADPILRQLKKGKVILRQGDGVQTDHLIQIDAIRKASLKDSPAADFTRYGAGSRRIPLSRPAPARELQAVGGEVTTNRDRARGQVLPLDAKRTGTFASPAPPSWHRVSEAVGLILNMAEGSAR